MNRPGIPPVSGGDKTERGFSLVEIAIGLVILSLAAVGLVASISKQTEQSNVRATTRTLEQINNALLAFAGSNGRLPCPAIATGNGQEAIASNAGGIVRCSTEAGFLPAVTLGLNGVDTAGMLYDEFDDGAGSGNGTYRRAYRYGISRLAGTTIDALTSPGLGAPTLMSRRVDVQQSIAAGQGLFICRSSTGMTAGANRCGTTANTLATNSVAVVWSQGINGNDTALWSADERQNAYRSVARAWVSRSFAPAGATDGSFDDQLTWISYPMLADTLVRGGFVQ